MNQKIIRALSELISIHGADPNTSLYKLVRPTGTQEWGVFIKEMYESGDLELFNNKPQVLGSGASRVQLDQIALWLFQRAEKVGVDQAVADVTHYISAEAFQAYYISLLTGLEVRKEYDFGDNVRLIPPASIPNSEVRKAAMSSSIEILPRSKVTSALILPFQHKRIDDWEPGFSSEDSKIRELFYDVRLCLSVGGDQPRGPLSFGFGIIADDSVPMVGGGYSWILGPAKNTPISKSIEDIDVERASGLYKKFCLLDEKRKAKFRIPMQRINRYASTNDLVQRAIDIRISLESIFLDERKDKLRYRLGLRASQYVGGEMGVRKRTRKLVKDAYDFGSSAVHSGAINKEKHEIVDKILKETASLVCKSIIKMIDSPDIKWASVELGGVQNKLSNFLRVLRASVRGIFYKTK